MATKPEESSYRSPTEDFRVFIRSLGDGFHAAVDARVKEMEDREKPLKLDIDIHMEIKLS